LGAPGRSGALRGAPWALLGAHSALGRSWALLGTPWAFLGAPGRSWALLGAPGRSLGAPGCSAALLGRSWALQPRRLGSPYGCCNLRGRIGDVGSEVAWVSLTSCWASRFAGCARWRILFFSHVSTNTRCALQGDHFKRHRAGIKNVIILVRNAKKSLRSRHRASTIDIKIMRPA